MKEVHYSTKMKKDLKKHRNNSAKMKKLFGVLDMLVNDIELPETLKAHKLFGQYTGCMECHIESDLLLIWLDENRGIIELLRLGSHSELF